MAKNYSLKNLGNKYQEGLHYETAIDQNCVKPIFTIGGCPANDPMGNEYSENQGQTRGQLNGSNRTDEHDA